MFLHTAVTKVLARFEADQLMLQTTFGGVDPKYHHNCSLAIPETTGDVVEDGFAATCILTL